MSSHWGSMAWILRKNRDISEECCYPPNVGKFSTVHVKTSILLLHIILKSDETSIVIPIFQSSCSYLMRIITYRSNNNNYIMQRRINTQALLPAKTWERGAYLMERIQNHMGLQTVSFNLGFETTAIVHTCRYMNGVKSQVHSLKRKSNH